MKFDEAVGRLFRRVFVCKKCKTKIRADTSKVLQRKIKCRRCGGKVFRPIKSKR
ncbi:hypothetical protein HZB88_00155 [archaeon]|nr:hypothetical protein [archaeon]